MFKPRKNQRYWMVNSRLEVKESFNTGSEKAAKRIAAGNAFKTAKEARAFKRAIEGKLVDQQKIVFDKRIAFAYGLTTGFFVANMIWLVVRNG